ncbi:MAG: hypothetical protein WC974_08495 [Thermoplasmata archaeon]
MKTQLSEIRLSNGLKFWVKNNLDDEGLEINDALNSWLLRTKEHTALSFINYLNSKPNIKAVLVDAVVSLPSQLCSSCKHLAKYASSQDGEKNCEHPEIGQIINSVNYQEAEYFGCNHFEARLT